MSQRSRCLYFLCTLLLCFIAPMLNAQKAASAGAARSADLTCSPAPCTFPNVEVSERGYPIFSNVIAVNPENLSQLLVAAQDQNCASGTGTYSSGDDGTTWQHSCLPSLPNDEFGTRPLLTYGLNRVAYAGTDTTLKQSHQQRVFVSSSTDNGLTWSMPMAVFTAAYGYATHLESDNHPSSPFKNSLYVVGGIQNTIVVSHSTDAGKTWTTTGIDRGAGKIRDYYPNLAVAGDGTVYATWLQCTENHFITCGNTVARMMLSRSVDGGNTWSPPVIIVQPRLAPDPGGYWTYGSLPGAGTEMSNFPVIAVDSSGGAHDGNLYVAFYNYGGTQMKISIVTSTDRGQTWSSPVRVSGPSRGNEFFQWVSVADDGTVGVTWLDTREFTEVRYKPYASTSSDGGATFSKEVPLSDKRSNPVRNMSSYIGEFRTHVWVGNALYAVWQDNHAGNFQVAIGGALF